MNNNFGMQPNNFNNQNNQVQNQPNNQPGNNVQMNNIPVNNVQENNVPVNNVPVNNVQPNNVPINGYPTTNIPSNGQMNQQYNQVYPTQNMNNVPTEPTKKNNKTLIIVLLLVVVAVVVGVVLFLGKDKDKEQPEDNKQPNENVEQDNQVPEEEPTPDEDDIPTTTPDSETTTFTPDSGLTSIPEVKTDVNGTFLMNVEDVFTISGRGTVATGRIERGSVKVGDEVQIIGIRDEVLTAKVAGIEMFRQQLDYAEAGDNAGILFTDISREDVERGQVLAKPNSIAAKTKFHAYIEVLTSEQGGRHTPFFVNYRPQFYFRTTDITGNVIAFESGIEQVNPGDKVDITVELITPVAMEVGTQFTIREGGKTIANGIVTEVLE